VHSIFIVLADASLHETYRGALGARSQVVFANSEEEIVRQVRDSRADVAIFHARPGSTDAFLAASKVRRHRRARRAPLDAPGLVNPEGLAACSDARRD
jgi:PleD family two-component response regulator